MNKKERYATDLEYREKCKTVAREWYHRNKNQARKAKREFRAALPEEKKEQRDIYMKAYVEKNREVLKEKYVAYRAKPENVAKRYAYERTESYLLSIMITNAKKRAAEKGVPFNLTKEDIIVPSHCPILGVPLERQKRAVGACSPSLDRIHPALGYVKGNVQVVSFKANTMKSDATKEELLSFARWVNEIYNTTAD